MQGQPVDLSGYRQALQDGASDAALTGMDATQKATARAGIQKLLDAVNADAPPGVMATWEQAQAIRRRIGDMSTTPSFVQDLGDQAISRIYGGIAGDLQNAANGRGVGAQFQAANNYSTQGYNFINRTASKGVTTNNASQDIAPEAAADALLNSRGSELADLRDRVPAAADALAAYNLRNMANAKPGVAQTPGETSVGTLQTNLTRLQTEDGGAGYRALYGGDPYTQSRVNAMSTIGGQMRQVAQNANTSRTAYANYVLNMLSGLVGGGIGGMLGGTAPGLGAAALSASTPYIASRGVITNPALVGLLRAQPGPRNVPGLLGGAISDIPTITERPQPQ